MPCLVCNSHRLTPRLDLGAHPVSSFFLRERNAPETAYNVTLGDCADCGTIQAMQPVPHHALVPPYDWLFAREPEEHLDATVENIVALPGVTTDCVVGALTYKDDTTVDRFRRKGFQNTWRVSVRDDLGVDNPAANIETVQKLTTADRMAAIAAKHGAADILIVRHILEHAEDVQGFLAGLAAMVKPGGIIMVEVPDCTTSLKLNDYCMVWEEHSLYLTPKTFLGLLARAGFEPIRTDIYPLPFENSLVQLARRGTPQAAPLTPAEVAAELTLLPAYAEAFPAKTAGLRAALTKLRAEKGPIALFGAGSRHREPLRAQRAADRAEAAEDAGVHVGIVGGAVGRVLDDDVAPAVVVDVRRAADLPAGQAVRHHAPAGVGAAEHVDPPDVAGGGILEDHVAIAVAVDVGGFPRHPLRPDAPETRPHWPLTMSR
jgi:hypothetical protein